MRPLDMDESVPKAMAAAPAAFERLAVLSPLDVQARLFLDEAGVAELARGAPLIRDDHNLLQTRAPWILERSLSGRAADLQQGRDPLPLTLPPDSVFHLIRRITPARGERLAEGLRDPVQAQAARGLLDLERRRFESARRALVEVLSQDPRHPEARTGLLRLSKREIERGRSPLEFVADPLDARERAVTAGWSARDPEAVAGLEAELAAVPPLHPLFPEATQLRAQWRIESGEPGAAREAIALVDRLLLESVTPALLLLRARACAGADENEAALHSLAALLERVRQRNIRVDRLAGEALRVTRSIPADPELASLRSQLEDAFAARR